jgi:hypothetical protein
MFQLPMGRRSLPDRNDGSKSGLGITGIVLFLSITITDRTFIQRQDYSSIIVGRGVANPAGCAYTTNVHMQTNQFMSFSRRPSRPGGFAARTGDTASGRCERPMGAKNLGFVPDITPKLKMRFSPHLRSGQVSSLRSSE